MFILALWGAGFAQVDVTLLPHEACTQTQQSQRQNCLLEYQAMLDYQSLTAGDAIGGFITDALPIAMFILFALLGMAIGGFAL